MKLEEFETYNLSMDVGEKIYKIVCTWDFFSKDTIGKQLVRSVDSIAANLSEGLGRFFYKETKQFCYYSRGSLSETKTWLTKANKRNLFSDQDYNSLIKDFKNIEVKLNNYIRSIGNKAYKHSNN